jgi:hypothetical protein
VVSPGYWLVSSIWFLLSTKLVGIVKWGKTANSCRVVRDVLPGCSWVALQLQLCLVSSSPSKVGNSVLNAALCPRDQVWDPPPVLLWEVGLSPHPHFQLLCFSHSLLGASNSFGRLACHSTPTLSLYVSPDLCWVLVAPIVGWLVSPPPLLTFAAFWFITESSALIAQVLATLLTVQQWEIGYLPLLHSPGYLQCSTHPLPMLVLDYSWLFVAFSFSGARVQST